MPLTISLVPVRRGRSTRTAVEDDRWDAVTSFIELDASRFSAESLAGLDAVDGTPVLDLKPWVREFGPRGEVRQPTWMDELMERSW